MVLMPSPDVNVELDALRTYIREAHQLMKDFKAVLREGRALLDQLDEYGKETVDSYLKEAIQEGLVTYNGAVQNALAPATEAVFARFDTIADELIGHYDKDMPSLSELAHLHKALRTLGGMSSEDFLRLVAQMKTDAERGKR